jgi:hypothetical protein
MKDSNQSKFFMFFCWWKHFFHYLCNWNPRRGSALVKNLEESRPVFFVSTAYNMSGWFASCPLNIGSRYGTMIKEASIPHVKLSIQACIDEEMNTLSDHRFWIRSFWKEILLLKKAAKKYERRELEQKATLNKCSRNVWSFKMKWLSFLEHLFFCGKNPELKMLWRERKIKWCR